MQGLGRGAIGGHFGQGYRGDMLAVPSQGTGVPTPDPMGKGSIRNELRAARGRLLLWGAEREQGQGVPGMEGQDTGTVPTLGHTACSSMLIGSGSL